MDDELELPDYNMDGWMDGWIVNQSTAISFTEVYVIPAH